MEAANNRQELQALKATKESFEKHCEKETARMKQQIQQEQSLMQQWQNYKVNTEVLRQRVRELEKWLKEMREEL
uniref:AlNc14C64G4605 protein n=1 Tax=Albugo laibachii Nc14 TaxID=890382 RepID=F0WD85_9STRA|nr:AlNc14C64G4605 [Albugo laibachii Nc14]|eukprot:CCA19157.1 AlNc14C64G4605 [Albugo laibachii Nc14]